MDIGIVPVGLEPSTEPTSFSGLEPKFKFATDSKSILVPSPDLSTLASRVLYYLFTTKGSNPIDLQAGGGINRLVGSAGDRASFAVRISRAMLSVEDTIRKEQSAALTNKSTDTRLKSLKLLSITYPTQDSASITILILAESGKTGAIHVEV